MSLPDLPLFGERLEEALFCVPANEVPQFERKLLGDWAASEMTPAAVLRDVSDEALAAAYKKGILREPIFQELFWERARVWFERWFFRWGAALGLPPGVEVADLTMDRIVYFWEKGLATYRPESLFEPYMYCTARNHFFAKKRRKVPLALENEERIEASDAGPEEDAIGNELRERIDKILLDLAQDQREVFREIVEKGLNAEQVAEKRRWKKQKVFRLLFLARRALERGLRGTESDAPFSM